MSPKRNPKFKIALFLLIPSAPSSSVEGRDTCMDLENFYVTPCFSHDYHLTVVEYIKPQNTESVCKKKCVPICLFLSRCTQKKSVPICLILSRCTLVTKKKLFIFIFWKNKNKK